MAPEHQDNGANGLTSSTAAGGGGSSSSAGSTGGSSSSGGGSSTGGTANSGGLSNLGIPPVTGSSSCELSPARGDTTRSSAACGVDVGPAAGIFKGCSIDSDCTLIRVANCTNSLPAYGVAKDKADLFSQCFPFPSCRPVTDPTMRVETYAEDGNGNLDGGVIHATCDNREGCPGMCRSHIP